MKNAILGACVVVVVFAFIMGVYGAETMDLGVVLAAIGLAFVTVTVGLVAYCAEVRG